MKLPMNEWRRGVRTNRWFESLLDTQKQFFMQCSDKRTAIERWNAMPMDERHAIAEAHNKWGVWSNTLLSDPIFGKTTRAAIGNYTVMIHNQKATML